MACVPTFQHKAWCPDFSFLGMLLPDAAHDGAGGDDVMAFDIPAFEMQHTNGGAPRRDGGQLKASRTGSEGPVRTVGVLRKGRCVRHGRLVRISLRGAAGSLVDGA